MNSKFWISIVFSFVAIIVSGIALSCTIPNNNIDIDYLGILIGILTLLVTLLVGWNIYSLIDLKGERGIISSKFKNIEKETNYLHNKADYHYGLSMSYNALALANSLTDKTKGLSKYHMLLQTAQSLKILSNLKSFVECNSLVDIILNALEESESIELTKNERETALSYFKQINNMDKITNLLKLMNYLQ